MSSQPSVPLQPRKRRRNLWFERGMAIVAAANLGIVVFDLTYVSWRDFWLQGRISIPLTNTAIQVPIPYVACSDTSIKSDEAPRLIQTSLITCVYDPLKGIEPHRETQRYLNAVDALKEQVNQTGIQSPAAQARLTELSKLSQEMIQSNPFQVANKSGTLERIKQQIRRQVYCDKTSSLFTSENCKRARDKSATEAFKLFWTQQVPEPGKWNSEIDWFDRNLRPLIATNYYRSIDVSGQFANYFGKLDLPFELLFLIEFLARTFYLSRLYPSLKWQDAMLWRWYDVLLFLPFWLFYPPLALTRAIPVAIRLHHARLLDMTRVRDQSAQLFVSSIAEELTEVVVVQVIDQVQTAVRRGEISRWLSQAFTQPRVDINNTDEVAALSTLMIKLTVYQVLPKIQPDLTALLHHNIEAVLQQAPAYQALKNLPGFGNLSTQLTERVVADGIQLLQNALTAILNDTVGGKITERLVQNLVQAFGTEVQDQQALQEIQALLTDLLEELKLGLVQRSTEISAEMLLEETRQLRQSAAREGTIP